MTIETTDPVPRRSLKNKPGDAFRCVAEGKAVPLSNDRAVDSYIVPSEFFQWALHAEEQITQLRCSLALLAHATAAGIHLPEAAAQGVRDLLASDEIARLNAFQAEFPVHLVTNEDGTPVTRIDHSVTMEAFAEDEDEELILGR